MAKGTLHSKSIAKRARIGARTARRRPCLSALINLAMHSPCQGKAAGGVKHPADKYSTLNAGTYGKLSRPCRPNPDLPSMPLHCLYYKTGIFTMLDVENILFLN